MTKIVVERSGQVKEKQDEETNIIQQVIQDIDSSNDQQD